MQREAGLPGFQLYLLIQIPGGRTLDPVSPQNARPIGLQLHFRFEEWHLHQQGILLSDQAIYPNDLSRISDLPDGSGGTAGNIQVEHDGKTVGP